jgi:hypothetical protein
LSAGRQCDDCTSAPSYFPGSFRHGQIKSPASWKASPSMSSEREAFHRMVDLTGRGEFTTSCEQASLIIACCSAATASHAVSSLLLGKLVSALSNGPGLLLANLHIRRYASEGLYSKTDFSQNMILQKDCFIYTRTTSMTESGPGQV